jgi:hypothetical protein
MNFGGDFTVDIFEVIPKWKTLLYLKIYFKEDIHNLNKCSRSVETSPIFFFKVCLGLPWLAKSIMSGVRMGNWYILVNSEALAYTVIRYC